MPGDPTSIEVCSARRAQLEHSGANASGTSKQRTTAVYNEDIFEDYTTQILKSETEY